MIDGEKINKTKEKINLNALKNSFKGAIVPKNTLLMSFKLTVGKVSILDMDAVHNEAIISIKPFIDKKFIFRDFLLYILPLISQTGDTKNAIKGKTLNSKSLNKLLLPLPPLSEQRRIIKKIKILLCFVERYGVLEEELTKLNDNFPELIKKSILQEAIQGKLVPQDPSDEPASVLLDRIREEKKQLVKDKKIKRNNKESFIYKENNHFYEKIGKKGEPVCIDEEIPFEIPECWMWVRLNTLGQIIGGGTPKTKIKKYWENGTIPWITPSDMKFIKGKYVSKGTRNITNHGLKNSSAKLIQKNSIIYSSRAPIGYIAITINELTTNQGFKSFTPFEKQITDYMYYCLISLTEQIKSKASGTTFKEISGTKFGKTLVPLPSLDEQERIVQKIEKSFKKIGVYV